MAHTKQNRRGVISTTAVSKTQVQRNDSAMPLSLDIGKPEPRIDSRLLAQSLGVQHESVAKTLNAYRADFETFGLFRFQIGEVTCGRPERYAMLNEDQAYLLLTYSRNTARVRELKVKLVKAFGEARKAATQRSTEYLPTYHDLHDQIGLLAADSCNARFVHMNVNKLINSVAGIDSGERGRVAMPTQSLLITAQNIATKAMRGAKDHHEGYQRAKSALLKLSALTFMDEGVRHV